MKVNELITELQKYGYNQEVVVFAEGNIYPTLTTQNFEGEIEIDCGWGKITSEEIYENT